MGQRRLSNDSGLLQSSGDAVLPPKHLLPSSRTVYPSGSSERSLHGWPELSMGEACCKGDGRSLLGFYTEKSTQGIEREATCVKGQKK